MRFVQTVLFLIWIIIPVLAQKTLHFTTDNGLLSNHIYRIAQDYDGFIWFLSDKGMMRYDGFEFRNFTTRDGLPLNDIWDIRFTPDGRVWFFTRANKLGYIEGERVFAFSNSDSTQTMNPSVIFQDGNSISFLNGLNYYKLSEYPSGTNQPEWITIKDSLGTKTDIFRQINQKIATSYSGQINDSLFLSLGENSYFLYNSRTGHHFFHRYEEYHPDLVDVKAMRFCVSNNIIQISGAGFTATINNRGELENISTELGKYDSHSGFVDKNNNLWMATLSNGAFMIPTSVRAGHYPIMAKKVSRLNILNGRVVASVFNQGFFVYNSSTGKFDTLLKGKGSIYSGVSLNDSTQLYLTDYKYVKVSHGAKKEYARDFENPSIFKALVYHDTLFGLSSMAMMMADMPNLDWQTKVMSIGLNDFVIFQGRLILASSSGLLEYKDGQIKKIQFKGTIFDKPCLSLDVSQGHLMVGTDGFGAYITDLESVMSLSQADYLSVTSIFLQKNTFWLATNSGVLEYDFSSDIPRFAKKYSINDGLLSNSVSDMVVCDNRLMVSSENGVCLIPLTSASNDERIQNIYFKSVRYNQDAFAKNDHFPFVANNQLHVSAGTVDYTIERKMAYEYRLLPIVSTWQTASTPDFGFRNLPPNKYQLEIRSGAFSKMINFEITPLWYQTTLARIGFGCSVFLFIVWASKQYNRSQLIKQEHKLSIRRKEIEQELYALRSQMNPHFVFNSLNAIQYYIANNDLYLSEKYLVMFSRLIRMFFNFSRKRTILLKEEIELLNSYLEMEKMRFGDKLDYHFYIDS